MEGCAKNEKPEEITQRKLVGSAFYQIGEIKRS